MHNLLILQISEAGRAIPPGILLVLAATALALLLLRHLQIARERGRLRRVEAELCASTSTYRALIDSVSELIYIQDIETGGFLDVNAAVERAYGYTREEIIGSTPALLADPARVDLEDTFARFREAAAGAPQRFDWWGRTRDGAVFPKEVSLVRGEYFGQPVIIAVARDISDRHAAEESMRRKTEEYREIFEADLVGNFVGLPDGSLESCNEAFCRIVGYDSVEEALTAGISDGDRNTLRELLGRLEREGRIAGHEFDFRRRDGRLLRILLYARATFHDGALVRFYGHCLDITEQKALAERVRDAQKLEAVGLLAGGVAHDFNNALTTVQGHAELLLEELPEGDRLREEIAQIRDSAERAGRLTRKLLAFSRRRVLRPRVVDLGGLVRDSRRLLEQLLSEDVELTLDVREGTGSVRADPGEIEQLLINLALNAREALPRGGRVHIRVRDVTVDGGCVVGCSASDDRLRDGPHVLLQVVDDGVGIERSIQGRLFEPFFTTRLEGEGRGLGLATVYGIVRGSGGAVWVESMPGHGATFSVCFPRAEMEERTGDASTRPPAAVTHVLLAEDESGVRRLTRRVLEKEGFRVHEADDGQAAIERAESLGHGFGLLVTDVVMPRLRGTELADRLQELNPGLRVLFMSGYTEADTLRDEALAPGQAFLAKPFTPSGLRESIRDLLDRPVPAGGYS